MRRRGRHINVRLVAAGITVPHADDLSGTFGGKMDLVLRYRHYAALRIDGGNREDAYVFAISVDRPAIRGELNASGVTGRFHFRLCDDVAGFVITFRAQSSRRVFHLPAQF